MQENRVGKSCIYGASCVCMLRHLFVPVKGNLEHLLGKKKTRIGVRVWSLRALGYKMYTF